MFLPIKITSPLSGRLRDLSGGDAELFCKAISKVRIGRTFKTSAQGRLTLTLEYLKSLRTNWDTILDIGASDGSASLALIESLACNKYILADKNLVLQLAVNGNKSALYDNDGHLHMLEWNGFLFYTDPFKAWKSPLERIVTSLPALIVKPVNAKKIICINPQVKTYPHVEAVEHDITKSWPGKKASLVIVANLLNKFHGNKSFMQSAFGSLCEAMEEGAILVIAENTDCERATFYTKKGGLIAIHRINGGSLSEPYFKPDSQDSNISTSHK